MCDSGFRGSGTGDVRVRLLLHASVRVGTTRHTRQGTKIIAASASPTFKHLSSISRHAHCGSEACSVTNFVHAFSYDSSCPSKVLDSDLPRPLLIMAELSQNDEAAAHKHIESLIVKQLQGSPIYELLLSDVRVVSVRKGHVVCRLPLSRNHMNSKAGIHGSVSATIVDCKSRLFCSVLVRLTIRVQRGRRPGHSIS